MLSDYLTSSYLQYKHDTNVVAAWLAKTAKKCGYAVDRLSKDPKGQIQHKPASGRLKGKARKLEREAANNVTSSGPSTPKNQTYIIAVKNFTNLAQLIVSHEKPPVRVPGSFVNAITRAISVRRSHGQAVSHQDEKSDERHGYFIGVLENVYELLQPRMPAGALGTAELATEEVNRFKGLEVEEPSEQFMNAPRVSAATPAQPAEDKYEAEQIQDGEEAFLAFQLLIQDYNKFRDVIVETWAGYRQGVFDLVSASLTTNTALDLARRMEEDVKPMLDNFGGTEKMLHAYCIGLCMENGEDEAFREQAGDEINFRMYDQLKNIYWPTYLFMRAFINMVRPDSSPEYKPGHYGVYDSSSDRTKKTPREQFKEDKILLAEFLPEASLLHWGSRHMKKISQEDEFIRGLRTAFTTHKLSLSLLFAGQVFLDIHHTLREDVPRGFADLLTTAETIDNSITLTLEFHTSLRIDNWPRTNDRAFKDIQERISFWVKSDPLIQIKNKLRRRVEPFQLMQSHPLLCGLHAYSLKIDFQEVSAAFVDAWGSILYTYHLYNACKQEKLLPDVWKDMDTFMGLQGDGVFVGDKPTKPEDYLKRFTLSMGYSATAFAKNKRKGPLKASKAGPRGLRALAPVSQMFQDRYCRGSGQIDWTLEDVEKVISRAEWSENELAKDFMELTLDRSSSSKRKPDASAKQTASSSSQLSATKLLQRLRNTLQGEVLELSMDYPILHRISWLVLRRLNEVLQSDLRDMYGVGYIEREYQLPWIVGYIFMAATSAKEAGKILLPPKKADVVTSKLLMKAAAVIKSYMDVGSGEYMCKVLEAKYNIAVVNDDDDDDNDGDGESEKVGDEVVV